MVREQTFFPGDSWSIRSITGGVPDLTYTHPSFHAVISRNGSPSVYYTSVPAPAGGETRASNSRFPSILSFSGAERDLEKEPFTFPRRFCLFPSHDPHAFFVKLVISVVAGRSVLYFFTSGCCDVVKIRTAKTGKCSS